VNPYGIFFLPQLDFDSNSSANLTDAVAAILFPSAHAVAVQGLLRLLEIESD
jgi:hypothetical protein